MFGKGGDAVGIGAGLLSGDEAGGGLNAAYAGGNCRFACDTKQTYFTGGVGMRTAAEFHGVTIQCAVLTSDLHDAHVVAVLVAEELHDVVT